MVRLDEQYEGPEFMPRVSRGIFVGCQVSRKDIQPKRKNFNGPLAQFGCVCESVCVSFGVLRNEHKQTPPQLFSTSTLLGIHTVSRILCCGSGEAHAGRMGTPRALI